MLGRERIFFTLMMVLLSGASANACSIALNSSSPWSIRANSKAVSVDGQCRAINVGVYDNFALGRAQVIGDGRIGQVINDDPSYVLLADCNTREITVLRGTATMIIESSCGPIHEFAPLVGVDAMVDLSQGDDLHDLVDVATNVGARESNPIEMFFEFTISSDRGFDDRYDVGQKDRFNLLCGCDNFYRNSPGATQ